MAVTGGLAGSGSKAVAASTVSETGGDAGSVTPLFTDIAGHPDEASILKLVELDVVSGYGGGLFGPDDLVTREQFAKMIVLAAGLEINAADGTALETTSLTFSDNSAISDWAKPYVAAAVQAGLINGMGDNTFAPAANVTRAQALTIIARALAGDALGSAEEWEGPTGFADDADIQPWARAAINYCIEQVIVGPADYASLEPNKASTRAMNCRYLARFVDRAGWADGTTESVTFSAREGNRLTTQSGLIVDVSPVDSESEIVLNVETVEVPSTSSSNLRVHAVYDITLKPEADLPEQPPVALTFPIAPDVDPTQMLILHQVNGQWTLPLNEVELTSEGLTLQTEHLSEYMFIEVAGGGFGGGGGGGRLDPGYGESIVGGPDMDGPVTVKTSVDLDEEGNLAVATTVRSHSRLDGYLRLFDAPWYHLEVDPSETLVSVTSAEDLLGRTEFVASMHDNETYLSPARAQELILTFYGTGGITHMHLSAGYEALPVIFTDAVYGYFQHKRMPWPLKAGDVFPELDLVLSFLEEMKDQVKATDDDALLQNRLVHLRDWAAQEGLELIRDATVSTVVDMLVAEIELTYNIGTLLVNWTVARAKGYGDLDFDIAAVPNGVKLEVVVEKPEISQGGSTACKVVATDANGKELTVASEAVEWSVSGGGAIDDEGTFTASANANGTFKITASIDDPITLAPVTATGEVKVASDGSLGSLSGTVYDAENPSRTVSGVPVLVYSVYSPDRPDQVRVTVTSGADGKYVAAGLPPGKYEIKLDDYKFRPEGGLEYEHIGYIPSPFWNWDYKNYSPPQTIWSVGAGRETKGANIYVLRAPGKVTVKVLTTSGEPISGVQVMVYGHGVMGGAAPDLMGNYVNWRRTDSTGTITIYNLPYGDYEITCPVVKFDPDDSKWAPQSKNIVLGSSSSSPVITFKLRPSGG